MKFLNATAAPSAAMSFREALNFCRHVVGMESMKDALDSKRVHGACLKHLADKTQPHQASPFTYEQLMQLEDMVIEKSGTYDALAAGTVLVTVLGPCRWSDLNNIHEVSMKDPQIFELCTYEHKTAGVQGMKGKLLPILVPIFHFGTRPWFNTWADTAEKFGRIWDVFPIGPLLPILTGDESLGHVPATSADLSKFLRSVLHAAPGQRLSSHSGKATLLSWSAKFGLPLEIREILGRHSRAASTTAAIYSRDLQGHAIESLVKVLNSVKAGRFDPEACRSKRWTTETIEIKDESEEEPTEQILFEDTISESSASSDEDFQLEPEEAGDASLGFFSHVKSQILHCLTTTDSGTFKCGAPRTHMFVQASDDARAYHPHCSRCFKES